MSASAGESRDYSLTDYLNKIGRIPLLTPAQEIELGLKVQKMINLVNGERKEFTGEEKIIIKNGKRAKKRMIESNLRLVVSVARKYSRNAAHMKMLDLIQEGNCGLIRAVEKFDPSRGYRFTTYAYWWIRQAVTRGLENQDRDIKIPIQITKLIIKIKILNDEFLSRHGRMPTNNEILKIVNQEKTAGNVALSSIELAINYFHRTASLDLQISSASETISMINSVSTTETINNEINEEEEDRRIKMNAVSDAMEMLQEIEKQLLTEKYGLNCKAMTAKQLAAKHKMPVEKVRDMISNSEKKLKAILFQFFEL